MSDTVSTSKLKRMMYLALRWRLQLPNYFPHNPVPHDNELNEFSRGVKCAYRDMLMAIEELEATENQRHFWSKREQRKSTAFGTYDDDNYDYLKEIRDL